MDKVRVVFATKTKHSQKIAEAMGQALDVPAENIASHPQLKDVDLVFIVGGIYGGKSMPELLEYVKNIGRGEVKRAALVTSCGSGKQGQESVRELLREKGIGILDEYICQGSFLFFVKGHPSTAEIEEAAGFAVRLAKGIRLNQ